MIIIELLTLLQILIHLIHKILLYLFTGLFFQMYKIKPNALKLAFF